MMDGNFMMGIRSLETSGYEKPTDFHAMSQNDPQAASSAFQFTVRRYSCCIINLSGEPVPNTGEV
jgi:hypothetical protein